MSQGEMPRMHPEFLSSQTPQFSTLLVVFHKYMHVGVFSFILTKDESQVHWLQITYSGAMLEVCMRKLVFYPEIVGFIEEEKDQFPSVNVQYTFNSPPKLILLDDEGQHKESIR